MQAEIRIREALADVFLLTTDAAGYLERLGFRSVERDAVPDQVRASDEFVRLCPKSATAMRMQASQHIEEKPGEHSW
jgi:N-acetylglutamate synthase-like GNAT family acetyltransferase